MGASKSPRIAEPYQSMVAAMVHATQQGWFTPAEAEELIDRVQATAQAPSPPSQPDNQ